MKQLFLMVNDGSVKLIDTPAPTAKANCVIVETKYSIVSAGTERIRTLHRFADQIFAAERGK